MWTLSFQDLDDVIHPQPQQSHVAQEKHCQKQIIAHDNLRMHRFELKVRQAIARIKRQEQQPGHRFNKIWQGDADSVNQDGQVAGLRRDDSATYGGTRVLAVP